jgi:phosphoribosylformylglycinamidine synthase PurS subunit
VTLPAAAPRPGSIRTVRFEALVEVRLRPGIADPQGATIEKALPALGYTSVSEVRTGKAFRLTIEADDLNQAEAQIEELCRRFLTNPVIEDSVVTIETAEGRLASEPVTR